MRSSARKREENAEQPKKKKKEVRLRFGEVEDEEGGLVIRVGIDQ